MVILMTVIDFHLFILFNLFGVDYPYKMLILAMFLPRFLARAASDSTLNG